MSPQAAPEGTPLRRIDPERVRRLAEGILSSFTLAKVQPLEAMASLTTAFSHIASNSLRGSSPDVRETNRELILGALQRVTKRVQEWNEIDDESGGQAIPQA